MRRGFTLIELLIVIGIIALLAGLLLAGVPSLRDMIRRMDTDRRMQQILTGVQQYGQGSLDIPAELHRAATGTDLRLVTLRRVVTELTGRHGLKLATAKRLSQFPPGIGNRWEFTFGSATKTGPDYWPTPDTRLDYVITFADRQVRLSTPWDTKEFYDDLTDSHPHASRDGDARAKGEYVSSASVTRWIARQGTVSPLGESLDRTVELLPDGIRDNAWYRSNWPNLLESTAGAGSALLYRQRSWPASDWDLDTPGSVPPVWAWPWGRQILTRQFGKLVEQRDEHHLGELSPLASRLLLEVSGVLPPGGEGADLYRSDRAPGRAWNDRWGNPLVAVWAECFAPRYAFATDVDGSPWPGTPAPTADELLTEQFGHHAAGPTLRTSRELLGGRDFLLQRAKAEYGFFRAAWLSVGAPGQLLRDGTPATWSSGDDAVQQRRLWLQVRETCAAQEWDEHANARAPWKGVRWRTNGGERCALTAPLELR